MEKVKQILKWIIIAGIYINGIAVGRFMSKHDVDLTTFMMILMVFIILIFTGNIGFYGG